MTFDVDGYLHRIGYAGPREPTADVLRQLQRAHLLAVPFENLDINPAGTPILLSGDALFDKVVARRRGGFCYELNGLFAIALEQLGYDVSLVAGQVSRGIGTFGPEFDHLALLVRVDGATYLADVGFGDFSMEPLDLSVRGPQQPRGGGKAFAVDPVGDDVWVTREPPGDDGWTDGYRFTVRPRRLEDFTAQCRWFETDPDSHFRKKRVCSIATADGRVTLTYTELIVTCDGERVVTPVSPEEWPAVLADRFGIAVRVGVGRVSGQL
jgi:N-hydroxyarylamine O-acetyltransferase